ncbi:MAG: hypothetical protein WC614_04585 [bacterium]
MNIIEGFRLDSLEVHFGRTVKTGDFENIRADLTIGGAITAQKDVTEVSAQLFQLLDRQISEQLKTSPASPTPSVASGSGAPAGAGKPGQGTRQASGKTGRSSHQRESGDGGEKLATAQQGKKIWAMLYNQGLSKDEIVQRLEEKFGTSDIAENVSVGDASDFIEELQSAAV